MTEGQTAYGNRPGPVTVREVGAGDSAAVAAVLADAFAADPLVATLVRGRLGRRERLRKLFGLELEHVVLPHGHVWVADGTAPGSGSAPVGLAADGAQPGGAPLRGACLVLPPGKWKMPPATSISVSFQWLSVFRTRLLAAGRLQAFLEEHHLHEPHWYIRYVGVARESQGQGIGRALLKPTLDRCDAELLPAFLEASSARSAALYERLGFAHTGELALPDGRPVWPMRRAPESSSSAEVATSKREAADSS
ncbi:MAG: GNAT family N-acetyltransferase [Candidatus Dormibacteria bacterium]